MTQLAPKLPTSKYYLMGDWVMNLGATQNSDLSDDDSESPQCISVYSPLSFPTLGWTLRLMG